MARDKRLDNPAFREAHKVVCKVYHEIERSRYERLPKLRWAADGGDREAQDLLRRYEAAMADRRASTKGA